MMVAASDCRMGMPKTQFEQLFGDAAAAVTIGSERVIAEIEDCHSQYNDFTDMWRKVSDTYVKTGEGRFIGDEGYFPVMEEIISDIMNNNSLKPDDFSRIVFSASDGRQHSKLSQKLGFDTSRVQSPFLNEVGHIGTAGTLVMLAAALEDSKPGDRILLANYGDGADAFILKVTESINNFALKHPIKDQLKKKPFH